MQVLVASCVLKERRTLRLMDSLFERIAAEENAQRMACERASVEWLAEKEKSARRAVQPVKRRSRTYERSAGAQAGLRLGSA